MKKLYLVFMTVAVIAPRWLIAEEVEKVKPDSIVADVRAQNDEIKIADIERRSAQHKKQQSSALMLPNISVNAKAEQYTGLQDSVLGPDNIIPAIEDRYSVSASINQPIFTGGRLANQRNSADKASMAAECKARTVQSDTVLSALSAYWTWSKAVYSCETLESAVDRVEARYNEVKNMKDAGTATENEALSARVLYEQTKLRYEEVKRLAELAKVRLEYLRGKPFSSNACPMKPESSGDSKEVNIDEMIAYAKTNRSEKAARSFEAQSLRSLERSVKAEKIPQMSLSVRYDYLNPSLMNFPPKEEWTDDTFAGISMSWTVFDFGLTEAKAKETACKAEQAEIRLNQTEDMIELQVREAVINLMNSKGKMAVAEKAVESARLNLESARDLDRNGMVRKSEVLDAHTKLTDAEYDLVSAKADFLIYESALKHALGDLK